eukprot:GHVR01028572.1.p1 GENE.GHVR01028572.1~~GHVR01028572.1.p1  ORF type:complete len:257 (+),score=43.51 GHVR01028572.1:476-1246(+)
MNAIKSKYVPQEADTMDYDGFLRVKAALPNHKFRGLFEPTKFFSFHRDQFGCVAIRPFFSYIVRQVNVQQVRVLLTYYDTCGDGYLKERDVENYVFEQIPLMPQLRALNQSFYPYYVFTAVRKFFFFLDPKKTGKIYIRDLLLSPILAELLALRAEDPQEEGVLSINWFSLQSAMRVYSMYLELDHDQNGMLSPAELHRYSPGLTEVFIQRVFQECQTYDGFQDVPRFRARNGKQIHTPGADVFLAFTRHLQSWCY